MDAHFDGKTLDINRKQRSFFSTATNILLIFLLLLTSYTLIRANSVLNKIERDVDTISQNIKGILPDAKKAATNTASLTEDIKRISDLIKFFIAPKPSDPDPIASKPSDPDPKKGQKPKTKVDTAIEISEGIINWYKRYKKGN